MTKLQMSKLEDDSLLSNYEKFKKSVSPGRRKLAEKVDLEIVEQFLLTDNVE